MVRERWLERHGTNVGGGERGRERGNARERERDQTSSVCTREDGTVGGDNGGEIEMEEWRKEGE